MGLKIRDKKRVEVTTSAGSSVLALTVTTTSSSNIRIRTELQGRRAFNTDSYCRISESFFKNISGTVTQVGSTVDLFFQADTDVNLATLSFSFSGNDIEIYVNGDPDVNILTMSWELEAGISIN